MGIPELSIPTLQGHLSQVNVIELFWIVCFAWPDQRVGAGVSVDTFFQFG